MKKQQDTIKQCVYGLILVGAVLCAIILLFVKQYWGSACMLGLSILLFSMIQDYIDLLEIRYHGGKKQKQ